MKNLVPYIKNSVPIPFNKLTKILHDTNYTCILDRFNYPIHYYDVNDKQFFLYQDSIVKDLRFIKDQLESINLEMGFVLNDDIFNSNNYPIISELAYKLLNRDYWYSMNNNNKTVLYKWLVNLILLNFYTTSNKSLHLLNKIKINNEFLLQDFKSRFRILSNWAYLTQDPSIKQHFKKRSISITTDVYAGFDSEFTPIDFGLNQLISMQLSVSGGLKMEIPLFINYKFEGVNTLTSETFIKNNPKFEEFDELIKYITFSIRYNRILLYKNHDIVMEKIVKYFINNNKQIDNFNNTNNSVVFQFKKLPIKNKFILGKDLELLKVKFNTLIKIINDSVHNELELQKVKLTRTISQIDFYKYINVDIYSNKETPSWNGETLIQEGCEDIILSNEINNKISESQKYKGMKIYKFNTLNTDFNINLKSKIYLLCHYNAADLSMLEDWMGETGVSYKNVDIIHKSFVSLNRSMKVLGCQIFIRDTILLCSAAARSLDKVATPHKLKKIDVSLDYKQDMRKLIKDNYNLFKDYAMQDSLITLIHGMFMNDFNFKLGVISLPVTLGSIANTYIKNKWNNDDYKGYQIHPNYPLGDSQKSYTPRGITSLGFAGETVNFFTGAFRGGRNECFVYGIDKHTNWYDYDLTSCYSTVMSLCGDPDYSKSGFVNPRTPLDKFQNSYSAVRVKFKLPKSINYPPLPINLDSNITVYPLEGEGLVTGIEYLTAINILREALEKLSIKEKSKYYIKLISGVYIPFKKKGYAPFKSVISELQAMRRSYPKKSSMERIYKDLGNMLYGKVVCGFSDKNHFDARSWSMRSIKGNNLANPIIGSWITGFVRSLLAELLNKVDRLNGRICSVTTDGFVTDLKDLENKILDNNLNNLNIIRERLFYNNNTIKKLNIKLKILKLEKLILKSQSFILNFPMEIIKLNSKYAFLKINEKIIKNPYKFNTIEDINIYNQLKGVITKEIKGHNNNYSVSVNQKPEFELLIQDSTFDGKLNKLYERLYRFQGDLVIIHKYLNLIIGKEVEKFIEFDRLNRLKNESIENFFVNNTLFYKKVFIQKEFKWCLINTFYRYLKLFIRLSRITSKLINICSIELNYKNIIDVNSIIRNKSKENNYFDYKIKSINSNLINIYRSIRVNLSGNPQALEVKTKVKGLIQWSTRGQISLESGTNNIPIIATTGFQRIDLTHNQCVNIINQTIGRGNKILYLQKTLSGALQVYKKNKQVSMIPSLRKFRISFDTKRIVIKDNNSMFYTKPYININECLLNRILLNSLKGSIYNRYMDKNVCWPSNNIIEETVLNFLRFWSNYYEFNTTYELRREIINLIINILPKYKMIKLLNIISSIESNKGKIVNKLNIFDNNKIFIQNLYRDLKQLNQLEFLSAFEKEYNNFKLK